MPINKVKHNGVEFGLEAVGIESVEQTTTSIEDNGENIITVTKTDGTTSEFSVRNGSTGPQGDPGPTPFIMWTNPNPGESFDKQMIELSTDDYDMYEIYYRQSPTSSTVLSIKGIAGQSTLLHFADGYSNEIGARGVYKQTDRKQLSVETAYYGGNTTANNSYCIPLWVVGYKTGLNLSIT